MNTEMQTTEPKNPATLGASNFSAADQISASDITIPRLKVMQTNSDLVKEDKAKAGSIIDPDTMEVYGYKSEKPFEFVALASRKFWLEKKDGIWTSKPANTKYDLPWKENGIERTFFHSFIVVAKKDLLEKNSFLMPMQLAFSSTGLNTVSTMSKIILQGKATLGLPSYAYYFKADVILRKKGTNSWYQLHCVKGADLSKKDLERIATIPLGMILEKASTTDVKHADTTTTTTDDGEY
jgi:hypothetical protein